MRIAFIVGIVFPTLSKTFIINQITGLIERGHEVDIYADVPETHSKVHPEVEKYNLLERTYYDQTPRNFVLRTLNSIKLVFANFHKNPGVVFRSLNFFKYGKEAASLRLIHRVIPHLNKQPYDVVHCHFGYNGIKSLSLRQLGILQGKLITTFHGSDITKFIQSEGDNIYDNLFSEGDLFLPISEHWKDKLIQLGCDKNKIIVHRMGVDCNSFYFTPRQIHPDSKIQLVTINRLVEKKGVEYGIRAVAELAKTNSNINYTIVGDGLLKDELQRLIYELNSADVVKLVGWKQKSEIVEILNNSHILLAPSITSKNGDREGIPVALMEAMSMGLPVISTFHSGIPELVENGVSGFLVSERDIDGLVEKLNYLIEHPEIYLQMSKESRMRISEKYNIKKLNDGLVKIYQKT